MKHSNLAAGTLTLLILSCTDAFAQQPYPQAPIDIGEMQKVQTEFEELKKQRAQERRVLTDKIAAEELAKAKKEHEKSGSLNDPYAVAEMRTRERIQALTAQWQKEDQELEARMHEKMMQKSGMGNMLQMQQQMMQQYGNTAPPSK
jgi:hypothetical protein